MTDNLQHSRLRLLLGFTGTSAVSDRGLHPSLVATYRLRVVALGALITAALLVNLFVYVVISNNIALDAPGFLGVAALGVAVLAGVVLLPWNRVLVTRWALRALYGWSVANLVVAGLAVYVDGGGTSVMFLAFPVLAVFFAIAYPQRAQAALLVLGIAIYALAVLARDWNITAAEFYIRVTALIALAYIASVLSGWLVIEMRDRVSSTSEAQQRKDMLDTVARAARRIGSLDPSHVVSGALTGAVELGCMEAEVWLVVGKGDSPELALQRRVSTNGSSPDAETVRTMFDDARRQRVTQVNTERRFNRIGALIHKEGEPAGLLVVRVDDGDNDDESLMIECVELLAAQASAGLDVARGVAERRGLEEKLAHWAFHDALTDLPNRVLFADRLELALARSARDSSKLAVLFLDLDEFKKINDTLGHGAGDELLRAAAERIQTCLRPNDTLARYGGDEFVVLVEQIDGTEAAVAVARRILAALESPVTAGEQSVIVKTSIGIAVTDSRPGADTDVVRRADMAMYQAKAEGGSVYVTAEPIA